MIGRTAGLKRPFTFFLQFVGLAVVGTIALFLPTLVRRTLPRVLATAIPDERPSEEYRIFHPDGFSIVRPKSWESSLGWGGIDTVERIELVSPPGQKPNGFLTIAKLAEKPSLQGPVREIQFQGRPAQMTLVRRPVEWWEHTGQLTVMFAFERDDSWWLLRYYLFRQQESVPDIMWKYFETFSPRFLAKPVE